MNAQPRTTKAVRQTITLMVGICILAFVCFKLAIGFHVKAVLVILTIFAVTFVLRRISRQPS